MFMRTVGITIFTPTFNRASHLKRLYESIKQQQYTAFEWVIVDDGSTDETRELVDNFKGEGNVAIRYFFQQNSGKHVAINKGVKEAKGELFFIVDSDDFLVGDALQEINEAWQELLRECESEGFAGICGLCSYPNGEIVGGSVDYRVLDTSSLDYRYRRKYEGDRAEVFVTAVLTNYPFPIIEGETFCTEGVVWNRIGLSYKMRFIDKPLYVVEYLEGGLSARSFQLRKANPSYAMLFYSELLQIRDIALSYKFRAALNFWRFAIYDRRHSLREKIRQVQQFWTVCFLPVSYCLFCFESLKKVKHRTG